MIGALATLLVLQLLGEALVHLLQLPLPGPVVGMALLIGVLALRPRLLPALKPTTQSLLQHLSLLFVPVGVGVMTHLGLVGEYGVRMLVAIVLSTWVGLAVTALALRAFTRRDTTEP